MKNKLLVSVVLLLSVCASDLQAADPAFPLPVGYSSLWAGFDLNSDFSQAGTMSPTFSSFTGIDFVRNTTTMNSGVNNGVTLTVTLPNAVDTRDRGEVVGQTYDPLLRELAFTSATAGQDKSNYISLALSDLTPNQDYVVRIYAYDRTSSGNRIMGVYDGSATTNISATNSALLATHRNVTSSNYSTAYYVDLTRTADAAGNIDLTVAGFANTGSPAGYTGIFNGLEIIEKPNITTSVFKVDIKNGSGSGRGTVQPTYLDWGIVNTTKTGSNFADDNRQYFYTDSGIKITIDPKNGDLVIRNRTASRPYTLDKMDLFRSFIGPANMEMTLDGLTVGQLYELTVYSADLTDSNNHYGTWSVFKDDAWQEFKVQVTNTSMPSEAAREFSFIFEADTTELKLGAKGNSYVFINGFELKELADPSITHIDVNTSRDTNNRPIAARAEELLFASTDTTKSMTAASGIGVTLGVTNAAGTGIADKSRFRNSTIFGHSFSQEDYGTTASLAMMQDFIFASAGETLTLTLDGLTVGNDYELTIYSQDLERNSGTTAWTLEGDELQLLFDTIYGVDATVDDWSHTVGFVADLPTITLSSTPGSGQFAFLNGFMLTDLGASDVSAVPEPATWVMMLLAMAGLVWSRRRR